MGALSFCSVRWSNVAHFLTVSANLYASVGVVANNAEMQSH